MPTIFPPEKSQRKIFLTFRLTLPTVTPSLDGGAPFRQLCPPSPSQRRKNRPGVSARHFRSLTPKMCILGLNCSLGFRALPRRSENHRVQVSQNELAEPYKYSKRIPSTSTMSSGIPPRESSQAPIAEKARLHLDWKIPSAMYAVHDLTRTGRMNGKSQFRRPHGGLVSNLGFRDRQLFRLPQRDWRRGEFLSYSVEYLARSCAVGFTGVRHES